MIDSVEGTLLRVGPEIVVIGVQGIGLAVSVTSATRQSLPAPGGKVHLYTYLHVREDALQLYGFRTLEEREVFLQLIRVSGVGPKMAMTILSALPVEVFRAAVAQGDIQTLMRINGIGKKTAQRLLLELKGKLSLEEEGDTGPAGEDTVRDAVEALIALGYAPAEAEAAVRRALHQGESTETADLVRRALKLVG